MLLTGEGNEKTGRIHVSDLSCGASQKLKRVCEAEYDL